MQARIAPAAGCGTTIFFPQHAQRLVNGAKELGPRTAVQMVGPHDRLVMSKINTSPVEVPAISRSRVEELARAVQGAFPETIATHCPLSRSQTRRVLSQIPETTRRPSSVTLTLPRLACSRVRRHAPLLRSQTRSVSSELEDTTRRPSGVTLTPRISLPWPLRVRKHAPLSRFQTRNVWSKKPPDETAHRPSGVTLTLSIWRLRPARMRRHAPLFSGSSNEI
jgi:hypothetical protein